MKSEKEMVRETKKCMAILNVTMAVIASVVMFLNYSSLFKDISYVVKVLFNGLLVAFVLVTCSILMYAFCRIRRLLGEFDVSPKIKNDVMIVVHCFSFILFNVFLMTMLAIVESN